MLSKNIEKALNDQLQVEYESSQVYLAMASWAESEGYSGSAEFLYTHSDEERQHMLKLLRYINERGGNGIVPPLPKQKGEFSSITELFQNLLDHEVHVTQCINELVHTCLSERDYTTHNFLQWYVAEQIEEEALAHTVMDKLKLIGNDKGGLYLFDRDIQNLTVQSAAGPINPTV